MMCGGKVVVLVKSGLTVGFVKLWAEVEETLLCRFERYQKHNRKNPCSDFGFTSDAPPALVTRTSLHIQNMLTSVGPVTTQKRSSRSAEL